MLGALRTAGVPTDLRLEIDKLYYRAGDYERALGKLEIATTDFVINGLKYMTELPKKEFEALLPALTKARSLLKA